MNKREKVIVGSLISGFCFALGMFIFNFFIKQKYIEVDMSDYNKRGK